MPGFLLHLGTARSVHALLQAICFLQYLFAASLHPQKMLHFLQQNTSKEQTPPCYHEVRFYCQPRHMGKKDTLSLRVGDAEGKN